MRRLSIQGRFNLRGLAFASAMTLTALGLSALAPTDANAGGKVYDQCLGFVIDTSDSTIPKGYQGQLSGIHAGLTHADTVERIGRMKTGMRVFAIHFSNGMKLTQSADIHQPASITAFATAVRDQTRVESGNNNLTGALELAESVFDSIRAEGDSCLQMTVDFSGDGANYVSSFGPHAQLRAQGIKMARKGIRINGLSFYDAKTGKYIKPFDGFRDLHDYYARVIVTPPNDPAFTQASVMDWKKMLSSPNRVWPRAGTHWKVYNKPADTVERVNEMIANAMRAKVIDEIADAGPVGPTRWAALQIAN